MDSVSISQNLSASKAMQDNSLSRVGSIRRLSEVQRMMNMQQVKQSNSQLEIKKFYYDLKQGLVSVRGMDEAKEEAVKALQKLKHDSALLSASESKYLSTSEKPSVIKSYQVSPFV